MNKKIVALLAVIALAFTSGCGSGGEKSQAEEGLTKVKVGVLEYAGMGPLYLGIDKGFFEKHGLDLELVPGQAPAPISAAVLSGDLQFGFSTSVALIQAHDKGLPLKGVTPDAGEFSETRHADVTMVKGDSNISSLADLGGKKVGIIALQSLQHLVLIEGVRQAGVDPSTVEFVQLAVPAMMEAVARGQVDAATFGEPMTTAAREQGFKTISENTKEVTPEGVIVNGSLFLATERYIADHSDTVKAFKDAMAESIEYAGAHMDELRTTIAGFTNIPPEQAKDLDFGVEYTPKFSESGFDWLAGIMLDLGWIESAPKFADLIHQN